ncbi:hypothetical protein GGR50DRAFT_674089 [Xylaria sp. CBS 124048]|nr:hypothetical protein GGR50DRAFT_674089 [Xylaria sp. CBS 124048]
MVFPGRFSTGCMRCRRRKVKCDEGKPSCRRCHIYGRPCPGYTDQFHFRFDKSASKRGEPLSPRWRRGESQASRHLAPRQQPPETVDSDRPTRQSDLQSVRRNAKPLALTHQPEVSYDDVSLCYFVRRFVTPDEDDSFPGHLSFLPSLYNHNGQGLLELATLSVAQMAAYNQFGGIKFRLYSYQNYGRALRALRETIHSQDQVTDDRVLSAVLLLSMFKDIGEEGWGDPGEHASGIYYLLEKRGAEQLCSSRGFELFMLGLLKLHIYSFLHQDDRYHDPGGFLAWLSQFDPMMRAMFLMTKTMRLRHKLLKSGTGINKAGEAGDGLSQFEHQQNPGEEDQLNLQECFEALEDFDTWDMEAQPYWQNTFGSRSVPAAFGTFATRGAYCDPRTACIIILIRAARLVLLISILEYHDSIQTSCGEDETWRFGDPTAWANCIDMLEKNVRVAIDDMLYCVPFAMGDLGPDGTPVSTPQDGAAALVIIQPMRLVTYCANATSEQRQSARNILTRMKSAIGVRSALSWDDHATSISMPHRPGTEGLVRAMASLTTREAPAQPAPAPC